MLTVRDLLTLPAMAGVRPLTTAGIDRVVRWVHIWPEVLPWPHGGELLLTTGYSWPPGADEQRRILGDLDRAGVAAILFRTGGPFFPGVPPAVLEEARGDLGLAVLEAGEELSFADLIETITREIIRSQFVTIERSDRIHRTLTEVALEAQAAGDIATSLAGLIDRRVLVLDQKFRVLPPRPEGWEAVARALQHSAKLSEAAKTRRVHRADLGDGTEVVLFSVHTGQNVAGYLVILSDGRGITDLDIQAGGHAAVVIGLHFLRQLAVAEAEARVRSTIVEAVLQGKLYDDVAMRERAQLYGFDPQGCYVAAVAVVADDEGTVRTRPLASPEDLRLRTRLGDAWQVALERYGLPVILAYSLNRVILLLRMDTSDEQFRRRVHGLWSYVTEGDPSQQIALAIGRPRRGDEDIGRSLREAEAALTTVGRPGIWWYDDLLVRRILDSATDRDAVRALWEGTLRPLKGHRGPLAETVRVLLRTGFRQREAARTLGVHWNTIRHRIGRIEHLLGGRLDDPEIRLRLYLAFEAEKVLSS